MPLEKKLFISGMNGDSEERFLDPAEYRYALNVRSGSSDNNNIGTIENVKGNTKVDVELPPGLNTCIGALEDKDERKVYYFIYNNISNHSVAEFDAKLSQAEVLLTSPLFNFSLENLITGANIIDDRLLKWTDDLNEPRELDVVRVKKASSNFVLGDNEYPVEVFGSTNLTEQAISAIKYAPLKPPRVKYWSDDTLKSNSLFGKLWQFRYQYVYLNDERSAWSPVSEMPMPSGEEDIHKGNYIDSSKNNSIWVIADGGTRLVKQVNIAARDGNLSDFKLIAQLDQTDRAAIGSGGLLTQNFTNEQVNLPISQAESLKLFDDVPQQAKAQELIDGNRLAYGNVVNGFDQVEVDVTVDPVYLGEDVSTSLQVNELPITKYIDPAGGGFNVVGAVAGFAVASVLPTGLLTIGGVVIGSQLSQSSSNLIAQPNKGVVFHFPEDVQVGDVYLATICVRADPPYTSNDVTFTASHTAVAGENKNDVLVSLATQIESHPQFFDDQAVDTLKPILPPPSPGVVTVDVQPGQDSIVIDLSVYDSFNPVLKYTLCGYSASQTREGGDVVRTFKAGARHKFGLIYSDLAGRVSTTMRNDDTMTVDTLFYPDSVGVQDGPGFIGMDITINHEPPAWAKYYQVVYSKNTTVKNYIQAVIKDVVNVNQKTKINFDFSTLDFNENYPNSILSYGFTKGDRLRFIRFEDTGGAPGAFFNDYVDIEITGEDLDNPGYYWVSSGSLITPARGQLIEVYTPAKELEEGLYYEIGEAFPIVDGFHKGDSQDQDATQPAVLKLRNQGDVYWRFRQLSITASGNLSTFLEDPNFSDFYVSNYTSQGRFNVVDKSAKRTRREATIYYSDPFIPDTNINGLSSFFLEAFEEYDKEKGSIQKMYSEDRNLLVFQELKVGKILVNTAVFNDLAGQGLIGQSTTILSDIQYYSGEYGIATNPESFAVYGNNKYFTDIHRGVVCRLGGNGITPISENGMHNYFTDTFTEVGKNLLHPDIVGEYDKRFEEYVLSIRKEVPFDTSIPRDNENTTMIGFDSTGLPTCFNEGDRIIVSWETIKSRDGVSIVGSNVFNFSTANIENINDNYLQVLSTDIPQLAADLAERNNGELSIVNIKLICLTKETIAFSENILKWSTFYGYEPDYIIENGIDIVTFKDGHLYTHNTNSVYNNFYEEQQDSRVEVVSHENPNAIKFYKNIAEESTSVWDMIEGKNQVGQSTNLIKEDFETIESHHYAAFWKDVNTPNIAEPLIEGDDMRSYTMSLLLRNDSVTLEKLFSVGIRYETSELSGK